MPGIKFKKIRIKKHYCWKRFLKETPGSWFAIGMFVGSLMMSQWISEHQYLFRASLIDFQDIEYEGLMWPVTKVPNYVALSDAERKMRFEELPSHKIMDLPRYNPADIRAGYNWNTATSEQRNAYITFSVPHLGNYQLDGTEYSGSHPGIDVKIPNGTPLYAVGNGYILKIRDQETGYGKHLVLVVPNVPDPQNAGKTTTLYVGYAHLEAMLVEEGQRVLKGDQIGRSGNTGMSTAPHLHFQIDKLGAPFYPYWPFSWSEVQSAGYGSYFEAVKNGLNQNKAKQFTHHPADLIAANLNFVPDTRLVATAGTADIKAPESVLVLEPTTQVVPKPQPVENQPLTVNATANVERPAIGGGIIEPAFKQDDIFVPGGTKTVRLQLSPELLASGDIEVSSTLRSLAQISPEVITAADLMADGSVELEVSTNSNRSFRLTAEGDFGRIRSNLLQPQIFTDITADHPQAEAIIYLKEQEIIKGYSDGSFKPQQTLNRAEALKIIMGAFRHGSINGNSGLSDVPHNAWFAPFINGAVRKGIVGGYPDGSFKPSNTVRNAEFVKMAVVASGQRFGKPETDVYSDVPADAWFAPYYSVLKGFGILRDTWAHPSKDITRTQAAEIIYELSKK